jgi:DNA polymerase-1
MLVGKKDFPLIIDILSKPGMYSVDTETTGLKTYRGDELFSIIIGTEENEYYFNFILYPEMLEDESKKEFWLSREEHFPIIAKHVLSNPDSTFFIHNAKYDMRIFAQWGHVDWPGTVHCTMACHRVVRNDLERYNLAALTQNDPDGGKSDEVKDYVSKHKLYTEEIVPWKKNKEKNPQYHRVPLELMQPYAETDGRITRRLGLKQITSLQEADAHSAIHFPQLKPQWAVLANERELTKTLFGMEHIGIKIDREYCLRAYAAEKKKADTAADEIKKLSGSEFTDSGNWLSAFFGSQGIELPKVQKKGPNNTTITTNEFATDKGTLLRLGHPAAQLILDYRESTKVASTYYANFLHLADNHDVIHANFFQSGTKTGRLSCSDPNLQNLKKDSEDDEGDDSLAFPVRKSFIPREDFVFFAPDYEQMEYRMMLDYCGQLDVIEQVIGGMDVHEATAQVLNVKRKEAKTINFMLLYGGGAEKLANALGCSLQEAWDKKKHYFNKLPQVKLFTDMVVNTAKNRGYVTNWLGRRCYCFDSNKAYTAPNHLIQGGCADVNKIALNRCAAFLHGRKSRLVSNVHDEIIFEIHKTELSICEELCRIMATAYPARHLPMGVDPSFSWLNLHEKTKGYPTK